VGGAAGAERLYFDDDDGCRAHYDRDIEPRTGSARAAATTSRDGPPRETVGGEQRSERGVEGEEATAGAGDARAVRCAGTTGRGTAGTLEGAGVRERRVEERVVGGDVRRAVAGVDGDGARGCDGSGAGGQAAAAAVGRRGVGERERGTRGRRRNGDERRRREEAKDDDDGCSNVVDFFGGIVSRE